MLAIDRVTALKFLPVEAGPGERQSGVVNCVRTYLVSNERRERRNMLYGSVQTDPYRHATLAHEHLSPT